MDTEFFNRRQLIALAFIAVVIVFELGYLFFEAKGVTRTYFGNDDRTYAAYEKVFGK